ncbi:hypothetical protein FHS60_000517 [Alloprevotella rava]|uniref:Uncharacterized protein n=1 Tax=Alloprevotella rava TaxID=671218 RepID=A0A7W5UUZ3_9BACT|nr:hypothetical protein [Alloprevotella rava]
MTVKPILTIKGNREKKRFGGNESNTYLWKENYSQSIKYSTQYG